MKKGKESVVKNQVILNLIQDLRRLLLQLRNNMRGRCQIKFGMTSLCNNGGHRGFTLIELLVVVLIIGILAAVALPQYQKAVVRSRLAESKITLKAIEDAKQIYRLENSAEPANFAELNLSFIDQDGNAATGTHFSTKSKFDGQYDSIYLTGGFCPGESNNNAPWIYFADTQAGYISLTYCKGIFYCGAWDAKHCKRLGFSKSTTGTCGSGESCYTE